MAQTPEGKVKDKVKKLLKKHGAWNFVPVSGGRGAHGIPDIIACHHGRFLGIECKAPNKKNNVSALQKMQLAGIRAADGVAMVVATDEDLAELELTLELLSGRV
jgi:Holliday junction resolvase